MTLSKNIAVLGCGYWGKNIIRSAHEAGLLVAVSDTQDARAQAFAEQYGVKALSFEQILAEPRIEGVMLAVPAEAHAQMAVQALAAGKHVFVEKPIALSEGDARLMIEAAKTADRILMVGHLLQYHPAFLALKEIAASGQLGSLKHIYSNRLNFGKVRTQENVLWSFAPHDVSMILALAGREPTHISAFYSRDIEGSDIASTAIAHFDFGQNLSGHLHVSWANPFKEQKLVVVGTKGMAVFDDTQDWAHKLCVYSHSVAFKDGEPVLNKAEAEFINLEASQPLKDECVYFAQCMAKGTTPYTDGDEALRVLKVMQACDRAAEA